ncbi:VOC family protein [Massilia arenosa]|uniref:VOC family protein n=1 Tax=Zemynaea arenosa TaxID=2561931 RepID=A0A4Y9SI60_9BURK|nr:VOC family protein [Massilia arenosa]TFW21573.1 VOC family protein [Massilia arenosa]
MLDHMTFRVSDIEKSLKFYEAALTPLGYAVAHDFEHDGVRIVGLAKDGAPDTWLVARLPETSGAHLAWRAASQAEVDAFYKAGLAAGGRDNGAPGLREHYHPGYYGAFLMDPDGNNIEAVFHGQ